ncbi:MFS transporter [Jidongwangia harbinensis]|uniref:MFS transporter n=1 Tax=Jidongwangia harbinensis TaxID=2878561 RepID=UPI001CDA1906|nr:MFS transporter [Jidongwangia harbinensis]MCA2217970.1 MFS transporter [Jidongwangia harbinensis]
MPPEPAGATAAPARGLLSNHDFVRVWAGETVSLFGSQITTLALPLVAIVTLQASAFQVGLLNVAHYAPFVALSLFAGVWFDRHRRRTTLIVSNLGRSLLLALIPVAAVLGVLDLGLLYTVAVLVGMLTVFFDIGVLSYVPNLVDRAHLAEANSKISASYSVAGIAGPGLAGLLIGVLSAPVVLALDALTYLFSAGALATVRRPEPEPAAPAERTSVLASIREGLRTVAGDRVLRHLATQSATFNLFENVVVTVFLLYAVRRLGISPFWLGIVFSAGSVGALLGALVANQARLRLGLGRTLRLATLLACLSPLLFLLPRGAGPVSLVVLAGALGVHMFHLAVFNVNALTLRQSVTPNHLLGRMNASYRLLLFGTMPLGALLGGGLAEVFGLSTALAVGVAGLATPIAWLGFSPVFRLRHIPDRPTAGSPEMETAPC